MGPLRNQRHERFVQGLFEGLPASRAFEQAGYAPNDGNAIRLKGNERIKERLAELQAAAQRNSEVTVASLLNELEDARQQATSLSQLSAAVRATEAKARISGLLTEKIEVKTSEAERYEQASSIEDMVRMVCDDEEREWGGRLTEKDREALLFHLRAWWEIIRAAKARVVQPMMSAEARDRHERRRLGLLRPTNGGSR